MSDSMLPYPDIVITGGLGGLGTTLALALRAQGAPVKVIDVLHPGCAPSCVYAHRRSLLEKAGVTVELADMRSESVMDRTLTPFTVPETELRPFWIHCAFPPPADIAGVPVESYEELAYSIPSKWIELAVERGWWYMVLQHLPAVLSDDSRLYFASWRKILEAEGRLRRKYLPAAQRNHEPGMFPMLPGLFGKHQSPHTLPLRQYLQVLAGRDVSVSAFDKPFGMSLLDSTVHDIVQVFQSIASMMGHEVDLKPNPHPDLIAGCEDWIVQMRVLLHVTQLSLRSDQGPGAYFISSAFGQKIAELPEFEEAGFALIEPESLRPVNLDDMNSLIQTWNDLPWIPPADWSRQFGRRRGRRSRS